MSCCNNTYDLGCYNHCQNIEVLLDGINPANDYTFVTSFSGSQIIMLLAVSQNDAGENVLVIDTCGLNENHCYTGQILQNSQPLTIEVDSVVYDCFSFKIVPKAVVYCPPVETNPPEECTPCDAIEQCAPECEQPEVPPDCLTQTQTDDC